MTAGITDWFTKNLNPIDFYGGLWTRFLLVPVPEEKREYKLPGSLSLDREIIRRLIELDNLEVREIDLSRILPMMKEWGTRHQEETMSLGTGISSATFQRLEVMLIKLASIFQISHDKTTIITEESFKEAVKLIEHQKVQLHPFFKYQVQTSESGKIRARILNFIKRKGRVMKTPILQGTKTEKKEADPALLQLIEEGEIKMTEIPTRGGGQIGRLYEYIGGQN